MTDFIIEKLVSGGQTGVDQAALRVAYELGIPHGGWCPKGRTAENGKIPKHFNLTETPSEDVNQRTERNVRDSTGTLILIEGELMGGTEFTKKVAEGKVTEGLERPCFVFDLSKSQDFSSIIEWIKKNKIKVLNVAGPRESQSPGINLRAYHFLRAMCLHPTFKPEEKSTSKKIVSKL